MSASLGTDRHANARDRKLRKRKEGPAMRGKRRIFEVLKGTVKTGRQARERLEAR